MPYVNKPRPYHKEYINETPERRRRREERRKARAELDKKGIDRKGKDVDHIVPLDKGGTNAASNLRVRDPNVNRSFHRNPDGSVKNNVSYKKK